MAALDDRRADPRPAPEEALNARQELRSVLAALQTLPEIDRAAVVMRAGDNMSYGEIAASLGISVDAAKVKVHRVRLKLAAARRPGSPTAPPMEVRR